MKLYEHVRNVVKREYQAYHASSSIQYSLQTVVFDTEEGQKLKNYCSLDVTNAWIRIFVEFSDRNKDHEML